MSRSTNFDIAAARRRLAGSRGKKFWAGIDELVDEEAFRRWVEAEFPTAMPALLPGGRRHFLKLMGASLLLGGLTSCAEEPADLALPFVNAPDGATPGVPRYYATAIPFEGYVQPVIATTYDGRPTKLDGNPGHPVSRGASDPFTQAAVLQLYDPDRSKMPLRDGLPATWGEWQRELLAMRRDWMARKGEGLRFLTGDITSPTLIRQLKGMFSELPEARLHLLEPVGGGLQADAMRLSLGRELDMHYRLENCELIVSLEADLLGPGPRQVTHGRAWSQRRGEATNASRMHVAESVPSLTGAAATTRLRCDASRVIEVARGLAAEFGIGSAVADALSDGEQRWVRMAAAALRQHMGSSLLAIGVHLPPSVQALAPLINDRLRNSGMTVWYSEPVRFGAKQVRPLAELAADIANGAVDTLVVADANPLYAAPADLQLTERLGRVRNRIHVGLYRDETGRSCTWHLPLTHALESWGDGRATDGTASIIQPLIAPLYGGRTVHQVVSMLRGEVDPAAEAPVRATWTESFGADFDTKWRDSLHDGLIGDTTAKPVSITPKMVDLPPPVARAPGQLEVTFRPDPCVWDGRFANVAWLQELPKPLTKLTWGNAIAVSPTLAERLHLANGDLVEVTAGKRSLTGPAWIMPGQAPDTIALALGHGRGAGGQLAEHIGYSAYALRTTAEPWLATGTLRRTSGREGLATTQLNHRMDGFDFVREVTPDHPTLRADTEAQPSLYPPWPSSTEAWGMVIDLDLCIGCNACIAACTAENNIAIVGKDQVAMGREMQWLRVDLYHTGSIDDPKLDFQPVPCMHCEQAPCEMGCPVHATVHSPDGLNQMVYNRCIGTRTCSSYCPYKVRRFNWYDYRAPSDSMTHAAHNPEVTVRSRGVMEKCTYCTQRIQAAHVAADKDNRRIREGEVVTACQQACPTSAIAFGNLNDPDSAVSKRRRSGRHYVLLEELGTRPRTTYLARRRDAPDKDAS